MSVFSGFSEFSSLKCRAVLQAVGEEGGAAALRRYEGAKKDERDRLLVLCDDKAERYIDKAGVNAPDTVNVCRAAAFSLVWEYAPALFSGSNLNGDEGREVAIAFYGVDDYTFEIFKALVSTYVEIRRVKGGVVAKKIRYVFFADAKEREKLKDLPYVWAARALERARGKDGYYEVPDALAEITTTDGDFDFGDAFVWAVVTGGREEATEIAAGLALKGLSRAVFYAGDENSGKDGVYSFDASDDCAGFYLKMLTAAFTRGAIYDAATGGKDAFASLEKQRERWKRSASEKVKRDSNLYAALALRGLLLSTGFDCKEGAKSAKKAFDAVYDDGCGREYNDDGTVRYDNASIAKDGLRTALAQREHLRWNEYMLACGVGPASAEEHASRDKNELLKEGKHVNVTTWEGLDDFRRDEALRTGKDEESTDVKRYDFQLADGAADMLSFAGYVITEYGG